MDYLRHTLWPAVKVRFTYWWWTVKYGGRNNIPPELIFERMEASMRRSHESLMAALSAMPEDIEEEKRQEFLDLLSGGAKLEEEIREARKRKTLELRGRSTRRRNRNKYRY